VTGEDGRPPLAARLCALLGDPEAPYAYALDAAPGTVYDGGGPPWPPLTVVEAQATPVREVLYHRITVQADPHPGEDPVRLVVNRLVGRLDDGREVPLGEVWAVPEAVLRAAEAALGEARCGACGLPVRGDAIEHEGDWYHKGCVG
jgi:hypothetical protein